MHALKSQVILGKTVGAIKLGAVTVNLDLTASVPWSLHTDENEATPSFTGEVMLEGEEYGLWGKDDSYIVTAVCKRLGLERA